MVKAVEVIEAVDKDGNRVRIVRWARFREYSTMAGGRGKPVETSSWLKTADGDDVNEVSEDEFEIVESGERLFRA